MLLIKGLIIFWILFVLHLLHTHPVSHKSKSGIAIWALKAGSNKTLRESKENFSSSKYSLQLQLKELQKETFMLNARKHRLRYSHGWSFTGICIAWICASLVSVTQTSGFRTVINNHGLEEGFYLSSGISITTQGSHEERGSALHLAVGRAQRLRERIHGPMALNAYT